MLSSARTFTGLAFAFLLAGIPASGQLTGGGKEYRSLNTAIYEISVQQNGRLSVTLANGAPIFENAFPLAQFEGKKRPTELEVDGRYSQRQAVKDVLGQGQGMMLRKDDCEWSIRAYPTQPFFAIQVSYLNDGKRPVKISSLMPFCIGAPKKGVVTLGPGTDHAVALVDPLSENPRLVQPDFESAHQLAITVPDTNRSLVMGFLTRDRSNTRFVLQRSKKADTDEIDYLRAECVYDPPIEVQPGERLDSEVLYISVGEPSALLGLQRMARATAVTNSLRRTDEDALHGVLLSGDRVNEADALETLDALAQGWTTIGFRALTIGPEWCSIPGDWAADPQRFPNGLQPVLDKAAKLGIRVGLTLTPFQVSPDSELARLRPEWLLPGETNGLRTLDPRAPGVLIYLGTAFRAMREEWGVSYFVGGDIGLFDGAVPEPGGKTHTLLMRDVGYTIKEAIGENGVFVASAASVWSAYNAHAIAKTIPTGAGWRDGVVNVLPQLATQFYTSPFLWEGPLVTSSLTGDNRLTDPQKAAWLTGLSMMRASIQLADAPGELSPADAAIMRRVLPLPKRPAQPMDLFTGDRTRIWSLPLEGDTGTGILLAVFNWNEIAADTVAIPLDRLGLTPSEYFTVYDSWGAHYHGTARDTLQLEVLPASVRVIGLRPFRERPMFLASDSHYTQGSVDVANLLWDAAEQTLKGTLEAVAGRDYALTLLAPERYVVEGATVNGAPASATRDERVVTLRFTAERPGMTVWTVKFRAE